MKKPIVVGLSCITDNVYAGTVLKDGDWGANKTEVTQSFIDTMIQWLLRKTDKGKNTTIITAGGKPFAEITIKMLDQDGNHKTSEKHEDLITEKTDIPETQTAQHQIVYGG